MDKRKPCGVMDITLRGRSFKVHLFDSKDWQGKPGAEPERFRLQQGRSWFRPNGQRYMFLALEDIFDLARLQLAGQYDLAKTMLDVAPPPRPDLRPGQRVRWMRTDHPAHERAGIQTNIKTPPFLAAGNTWKVFLAGGRAYLGTDEPVPCSEVQPLL